MDRTLEFRSFIKLRENSNSKQEICNPNTFYDAIYHSISEIYSALRNADSYRTVLNLDEEVSKIRKKADILLGSIQIKGGRDLQAHFEGIKFIINTHILNTIKAIERSKSRLIGHSVDLQPEKANLYYKRDNENAKNRIGIASDESRQTPVSNLKSYDYQILEQENKAIVEQTQYEATRQRLLKIDVVQKAINENLLIQDERIDSICVENDKTAEVYKTLNSEDLMAQGSMIRRFLSILVVCLTIVLVFLHIYYRN